MQFLLNFFIYAVGNGLDVGIGIAFTNNEEVCRSIAEFPKVKLNDIFAFFIPNALDDEVIEFFEIRITGFCPPCRCGCYQVMSVEL